MIKLLLLIPALSVYFSNGNINTKLNNSEHEVVSEKQLTFADLTQEEKDNFIAHVIETGDCEWKGIKLFGKVQFVDSYPDFKVQFVDSYPDIKVEFVSSYPDKCGKWQEVSSYPDFKIQVVTSYPDLKVKKVTSYPGMN